MTEATLTSKPRPPAALFALGYKDLPAEITVDGISYRFLDLFKHDFFAATGLYQRTDSAERAVLKIQRTHHFWGIPMAWLGRWVSRREISIYQHLHGVRGIPKFLGTLGTTGFLHEFIPGHDLDTSLPLSPQFFEDLHKLFQDLHDRHIAYVDANKRENILYGDDGRPWLIDFQISFIAPHGDKSWWPRRWWIRRFIAADWYHFYKHKTRLIPKSCTPDDFARANQRGFLHTLHRFFAHPIRFTRRWYLQRYDLSKTK